MSEVNDLVTQLFREYLGLWLGVTVTFCGLAVAETYLHPGGEVWFQRIVLALGLMILAKAAIVGERVSGKLRKRVQEVADPKLLVQGEVLFVAVSSSAMAFFILLSGFLAQRVWAAEEVRLGLMEVVWFWVMTVLTAVAQAGTSLVWNGRWRWSIPSFLLLLVIAVDGLSRLQGGRVFSVWPELKPAAAIADLLIWCWMAWAGYRLAHRCAEEALDQTGPAEVLQLQLDLGNSQRPRVESKNVPS